MKRLLALAFLLAFPAISFAQQTTLGGNNLGEFLLSIVRFINDVLVPVVWAIAFIVFIWGIFQYFIAGGADEEKRSQGKQLAFWGIVAFFVMMSLWGIVNLVDGTFQFGNNTTPDLPDFDVP